MAVHLSDELVRELQRNGNQPLAVEDPRTHRLYVLVAADKFVITPQGGRTTDAAGAWTETKNARRFSLIDKEIDGSLTPDEALELADLQRQVDSYIQQVAPLPLAELQKLHDRFSREAV